LCEWLLGDEKVGLVRLEECFEVGLEEELCFHVLGVRDDDVLVLWRAVRRVEMGSVVLLVEV
jgi:hypothetical protein